MAFDITPYIDMKPSEVRKLIREGVIDFPTAGMCRGYAQANLIILPPEYAGDFEEFARRNPFPCPILEIVRGTPETHDMGEGGNICTDIPKYRIYRDGKWDGKELTDVSGYWKEGYVGFLIGCSFSFEEALMREGIEVRHIAQGRNVPMFKTNIMTEPAGPFCGPMVCSMRPMTPENAKKAYDITVKMPNVHGAPVLKTDFLSFSFLDFPESAAFAFFSFLVAFSSERAAFFSLSDISEPPVITLFLCAKYVSGRTCSVCSFQSVPDCYACSSWLHSCDACILCKPVLPSLSLSAPPALILLPVLRMQRETVRLPPSNTGFSCKKAQKETPVTEVLSLYHVSQRLSSSFPKKPQKI